MDCKTLHHGKVFFLWDVFLLIRGHTSRREYDWVSKSRHWLCVCAHTVPLCPHGIWQCSHLTYFFLYFWKENLTDFYNSHLGSMRKSLCRRVIGMKSNFLDLLQSAKPVIGLKSTVIVETGNTKISMKIVIFYINSCWNQWWAQSLVHFT